MPPPPQQAAGGGGSARAPAAAAGAAAAAGGDINRASADGGAAGGGWEEGAVSLAWRDITAFVPDPKKKGTQKRVLDDVSGRVDPGQVLAVMGPSGAGKTTLLNILAGRPTLGEKGRWDGDVRLDGVPVRSWPRWQRCLGYVMQRDIFFEELTLRDTLGFAAQMRLPYRWGPERKQQKVSELTGKLGLDKVLDTRIGTGIERGLSGGELKRTSIVSELLALPRLLLLDEPLTGLDSSRAQQVLEMLRHLALREGRTVLLTVHQPSSSMWKLFDRLLLLAPGGHVVFQGEAKDVVGHFSSLGFRCPTTYNPPDFFMDVISDPAKAGELVRARARQPGEAGAAEQPSVAAARAAASPSSVTPLPPLWYQVSVLSRRGFMQTRRALLKPMEFVLQLGIAGTIGLLWWQVGRHMDSRMQDYVSTCFFCIGHWSWYPLFQGLQSFPKQRDVLTKDRASHAYSIEAYFISKVICEMPVLLVLPAVFFIVLYPMAWLPIEYLPQLFGIIALNIQVSAALSMLISVTVFDEQKAIVLAICVMVFTMCAGGYFVNMSNMPVWIGELRWASYWYYSIGLFFHFAVKPGDPAVVTDTLKKYSFSSLSVLENVAILIGYAAICRLLAYIVLRSSKKTRFS